MSDFEPWADDEGDDAAARAAQRGPRASDALAAGTDDFDPFATDSDNPPPRPSPQGRRVGEHADGVALLRSRRERRRLRADSVTPGGRILTVCTGNICRSPYMERVLAHELAPLGVEVRSAGTGALAGRPIDPGSAALLEARGIDTSGYAARQLTVEMVEQADLVLTATREHRRLVVQEAPSALRRVFAVLDFADLCEGLDPADVARAPGANLVARLVAAAGARRASVPARQDDAADVVDPYQRNWQVFQKMADQASEPLSTIARALSRQRV